MLLLLAVLLAGLSVGVCDAKTCPSPTRDDLLICLTHLDANEDGTLSAQEIDLWAAAHVSCLPHAFERHYDGQRIVSLCDVTGDGALTMADWNAEDACLTLQSRQRLLCDWCVRCGVYPE